MKKIIMLSLAVLVSLSAFAQDLLSKIPKDAVFVSVLKGSKVLSQVSEKELMQYQFTSELFSEIDNAKSFDELGVDLNRNFYFFTSMTDSISYNCVLMPLKSASKIPGLLGKRKKVEDFGAYKGIASNNEAILWDNTSVLFVSPFGIHPKLRDYGAVEYEVEEDVAIEEEPVFVDMEIEDVAPVAPERDIVKAADPVEAAEEMVIERSEEIVEVPEVEVIEEPIHEEIVEYVEEEVVEEAPAPSRDYSRRNNYSNRRNRTKPTKGLMRTFALGVMSNSNKINSMAANRAYLSKMNNKAAASAWTNSYGEIYAKLLGATNQPYYGYRGGMMSNMMRLMQGQAAASASGVESITANLFLNDDNAEVEVATVLNDEMAGYSRQMSDKKFNRDFFKYFDGDKVMGYLGVAVNVENTIEVYPKMVTSIMQKVMPEYRSEAALGAEFLSILLDEEAIGELINGDMMFVVSDVVEKEVKYMSYEYDENYNSTRVEKTKMEPIPEFLYMVSSEKPEFIRKFLGLGQKYKVVTPEQPNLYKISTKETKLPIEMYIVLKDDIFFLSSSEYQARDIANGKKLKLSRKHKRKAKNKNMVFYANNDAMVNAIPKGMMSTGETRLLDYYQANFKEIEFSSAKVKGNVSKTKMVINTGGDELNALQSFFGMFDGFISQ